MENKDEIIDKIRKLLALAERGGTEAEGEAAMRKVQELLTKHNLDIDSIKTEDEVAYTREYKEYEWNATWIKPIYIGLAKLYFCHVYFDLNGQRNQQVFVVGKPVNVMTVQFVADMVIATGKRLAKSYAQECYREWQMNPVSASNDFKKGYATRINARCFEMIREVTKPDAKSPGTSLVVKNFYEKELAAISEFEKNVLGLKFVMGSGMKGAGDRDHAQAGASAADSVSLTANSLGGGNKTFRLTGSK